MVVAGASCEDAGQFDRVDTDGVTAGSRPVSALDVAGGDDLDRRVEQGGPLGDDVLETAAVRGSDLE